MEGEDETARQGGDTFYKLTHLLGQEVLSEFHLFKAALLRIPAKDFHQSVDKISAQLYHFVRTLAAASLVQL